LGLVSPLTKISQRLFDIWSWLRSNAERSFMKKPSTWPPKMKILEPSILSECPYRPDGRCPAGRARDHCLVAEHLLAERTHWMGD
jgi:hypothetical protein